MKKTVLLLLSLLLVLSLCACSHSGETENESLPPAFGIIRRGITLNKRVPQAEGVAFSPSDFEDALGTDIGYITIASLPGESEGVLIFNGIAVMRGQTLPAESLEFLRFVPEPGAGNAAFTFNCDGAGWKNEEIECCLDIGRVNSPPVADSGKLKTLEGLACGGRLSVADPDGDEYSIDVVVYPSDGFIKISSDGEVIYTPEEGYYGSDALVYTVTDSYGAVSERATLEITVGKNNSGIRFADMEGSLDHRDAVMMCDAGVMVYRYENGKYYFEPDSIVSKMDYLVMLMCAAKADTGVSAVADTVALDDGKLSSGMKGFLAEAVSNGTVFLDKGKFHPDSSVTRADAAYMAAKLLSLPKIGSVQTLSDYETIPAWAKTELAAALNAGIISASDGMANASEPLTKREVASMLCLIAEYIEANNMKSAG